MKTPVLETERLLLRPVTLDDASAIQKYFNSWKIIQYLNTAVPWPYPENGAETFLKNNALPRMQAGDALIWAITIKDIGNEAIGLVDFGNRPSQKHGNRGFWLAEHFHGKGFMTEAVKAVNDFIFLELGVEKFLVTNVKSNIGSKRVKEKTGARFLRIDMMPHHNGELETEVWEVTREKTGKR